MDRLFHFLIDKTLELIICFDEKGLITYANPSASEQLGYEEGLAGHRMEEVFPEGFPVEEKEPDFTIQSGNHMKDMIAYRKNNTCFSTRGRVYPYREPGQSTGYVFIAYNSSNEIFLEKKANQAGQEAEEALKVKSEFVANVTHELRTPVNGISGNARELLSIEEDREKRKKLELIEHGCRDMNELINSILDFSKLEAGKFTLEPRQFDFREMVEYVKDSHSPRITEKGLDFSVSVSPGIPSQVIGDRLRIVQILNNLLSNAYKFTAVGGIHVEVVNTTRIENRLELFFMVIDSGCGIPREKQDKLFQSFVQADASISRKYGGTGLGLYICKQLAELMGGSIHVQSDSEKGSVFTFNIWLELPPETEPEDSFIQTADEDTLSLLKKLQQAPADNVNQKIWQYDTSENRGELEKKMSKLVLCVEMENWEKAEMFADTVKKLVEEAPREVKSAALKLKMSVQKGDYEKTMVAFELLKDLLKETGGKTDGE